MTDQPTPTETPTETEPARPDLEGMLRRAETLSECALIEAPMRSLFTDALMPVLAHALRLESELKTENGWVQYAYAERDEMRESCKDAQEKIAELEHSNAALLAANIEETARADNEKQRADRAEKEKKELHDRVFPPIRSAVITAPLPSTLPADGVLGPNAANLSPRSINTCNQAKTLSMLNPGKDYFDDEETVWRFGEMVAYTGRVPGPHHIGISKYPWDAPAVAGNENE